MEDGRSAIPILDSAPPPSDLIWNGNPHLELAIQPKRPSHWLDHFDLELAAEHSEDLPRSYEIQGDVLIVKLEETVSKYGEMIADAMLTQLPSIRLVCADLGVKGEYRVRGLEPLASRDGTVTTRTRIKENGYLLWVDPSNVYFSSRLSNERIETLASANHLRAHLERPLVVCDPYAGVGPSMGALLSEDGLVSGCLVGDLNPEAFELLELNLEHLLRRRKDSQGNPLSPLQPMEVACRDAKQWLQSPQNLGVVDLLLVNLPHHSIEHIPTLLPLLKTNQTTVLRGWAIVDRAEILEKEDDIRNSILSLGARVEKFAFTEVKGFSTTKSFMCFEVWMNLPA